MTFVHEAAVAVLLTTLTLWLQLGALAALLIPWARNAVEHDIQNLGAFRSAALIVRFTTAAILLHGLQILLWAICYRWISFPSLESAFYFSAVSYTTVGYGDIVLPSRWRLLGPVEGITGVLMCGISASLLFALVMRLIDRAQGSS